jgi:predicted enzyme related to lactoylglutathione lyase
VEVSGSRILPRPADPGQSRHFYRDVLGLAVYREFGPPDDPGVVFFPGSGFLEVSGHADGATGHSVMIWLQVRDVAAEHERLAAAGVRILREPVTDPWGLTEMWIKDPTASTSSPLKSQPTTHCAATHEPHNPPPGPSARTMRGVRAHRGMVGRWALGEGLVFAAKGW